MNFGFEGITMHVTFAIMDVVRRVSTKYGYMHTKYFPIAQY